MTIDLQETIERTWLNKDSLCPAKASTEVKNAIETVISGLDNGRYRVAEKKEGKWVVYEWIKKAILLSFRLTKNRMMGSNPMYFYDKVPLKFSEFKENSFEEKGYRVVPPASVRRGSFIGRNVVLMPSYVNIGAHVGEGAMIDTWATVGSCAQIGKNVHLSGGAGIGGVLEPLQAKPTIIEDNCFIGARSEIVEGVIVGEDSVVSMGVFLSQATKIYSRITGKITYGYIPSGSVVVPGSLPSTDGSHSLSCAVIVKHVDKRTREKTSVNALLRGTV